MATVTLRKINWLEINMVFKKITNIWQLWLLLWLEYVKEERVLLIVIVVWDIKYRNYIYDIYGTEWKYHTEIYQ